MWGQVCGRREYGRIAEIIVERAIDEQMTEYKT